MRQRGGSKIRVGNEIIYVAPERSRLISLILRVIVLTGAIGMTFLVARQAPAGVTVLVGLYALLLSGYILVAHSHIDLVATGRVSGRLYAQTTDGRTLSFPIVPAGTTADTGSSRSVDQPRPGVCVLRGATVVEDAT